MALCFAPSICLSKRRLSSFLSKSSRNPTCPATRHKSFSTPSRFSVRAALDDSRPSTAPVSTCFTWAVGHSKQQMTLEGVSEAISRASATLSREGVSASVAFLFVKSTFASSASDNLRRLVSVAKKSLAMRRVLAEDTIIHGCTSSQYTEHDDLSVSVILAHFPKGAHLSTFYIENEASLNLDWKQRQWHEFVGMPCTDQNSTPATAPPQMNILLLQHPEFDAMEDLLSALDFAYPSVRKLGSSAGKSNAMHESYLFSEDGALTSGVLGLAFASPDVQVDITVAQGARGVGPVLEVLEVREGNEITRVKEVNTPGSTIGPPMVLLDMWANTDSISPEDREHARKYLLFGVEVQDVVDLAVSSISQNDQEKGVEEAVQSSQKPIDMVIRKVVGFNQATKSLGIEGGDIRLGSRVQFQIRDEEAARGELTTLLNKLMLEGSSRAMDGMSLMGALLFVDAERGENLYGNAVADLDRAMYVERFPVPLAVLTSERQIGPLPAGGLLGTAGDTFTLSASALYVSFYGRTGAAEDQVGTGETSKR